MSHAERTHAKYSGSGASRWFVCTGQPDFVASLPPVRQRETLWTREGAEAHEILAKCVQDGKRLHDLTQDDGIIYSVQMALDYVTALKLDYDDLEVYSEAYFSFPQDVVPIDDCGGTPDLILYSPKARRVWCIDFKHGEGVVVEAERNLQLWSYLTSFSYYRPVVDGFTVIIQPRAEHPRGPIRGDDPEEVITAVDMLEFVAEVDAVLRGPKVLVAGPHCRWCPAETVCPEREKAALSYAREIFSDVKTIDAVPDLPNPRTLDADRLGRILALEGRANSFFNAAREVAIEMLHNGQMAVPGWKLVEAQARRKWFGDPEKIAASIHSLSGMHLSLDEIMPRKLATITDITEKLMVIASRNTRRGQKTGAKEEIKRQLAFLTSKESSGNLTLVPDTDGRPSTTRAIQTFAGISLPPQETLPVMERSEIGGAPLLEQSNGPNPQNRSVSIPRQEYRSYADER
jgi:Protein of unknown function (DUF2800)